MGYTEFESLLKEVMGLDAASIGSSAIERAVQDRRSACKLKDTRAYLEHVRACRTELQELIEAVVVPETWFFRDQEAFATLARMAHEERLRVDADGVMRLLSLPCSTGEEPYSMAIALLDAGVPASCFQIDAVDISSRALTHAQRAVYGKNSFRGTNLDFRDRHFETTVHGYRLSHAVRGQVHFKQGNLLSADFLPGAGIYDVVFCRNVLIYFDRATQDRTVHVLQRLLTAKGALFVGPSETALPLSHDFISARVPLAFAFHKLDVAPLVAARRSAYQLKQASVLRKSTLAAPVYLHKSSRPPSVTPAVTLQARAPAATPNLVIDEAARLADQGHLAEAAKSCEEHMRSHGPSAQAFYLMGLIRDAGGNVPEAALYYRKALYLDQDHQETLIHLAFLLEKQGEIAGARLLRNRMLRVQRNSAK